MSNASMRGSTPTFLLTTLGLWSFLVLLGDGHVVHRDGEESLLARLGLLLRGELCPSFGIRAEVQHQWLALGRLVPPDLNLLIVPWHPKGGLTAQRLPIPLEVQYRQVL